MTEQEKRELEARRREAAITNMYYNRYLMVRYAVAVFLFVNIYWAATLYTAGSPVYLLVLPILLALGFAWAMWEMARMNTREQQEALMTRRIFRISALVNIFLIIIGFIQGYSLFFPLFKQNQSSFLLVLAVQAIGLLLSFGILSRLRRIHHKADKQYQRIQTYLASVS